MWHNEISYGQCDFLTENFYKMTKTEEAKQLIETLLPADTHGECSDTERLFEIINEIENEALAIAGVSHQRELLAAFVKDWYKDNPMVDESKQLKMVDKFLAAYSG